MVSVETIEPRLTLAEFDALPDDGEWRELLDGRVLVTPAPRPIHQTAAGNLYTLLRAARTPDLLVYFAPFDYRPGGPNSLQPDVLVCHRQDVGPQGVQRPLLLAVEVASPSTRHQDVMRKRLLYEAHGVQSYWIFEPEDAVLVVLELKNGQFVDRVFKDDEVFEAELPYPVQIVPAELLEY
ncbi:Uma2 family endonuclease [Kribbella albertanoniae]|uniref:Uma2 family endonuclease n=1 Tax=Kribbella albertanoniae TaxID=1266829 RepID=A0A4R4NXV4_9ACTN|nr:Uma2 family endonuclease [Kribbella albertanoniae]